MNQLGSVDNALRILLLLAERGRLGVTEVALKLDVAPSTAHRLLSTLRHRGFVVQDQDRSYRQGPALQTVVQRPSGSSALIAVAQPFLERLQVRLDETCHLVMRTRREVRFLASVEAHQALRVSSRAGMSLAAHQTSGGKLLLAQLPGGELSRLYPPQGVPEIGMGPEAVDRLVLELRSARRRGYAVNRGESERGISAVAVGVQDRQGRHLAALTVSVPTVRFSTGRMPELLDALRASAQGVSAAL